MNRVRVAAVGCAAVTLVALLAVSGGSSARPPHTVQATPPPPPVAQPTGVRWPAGDRPWVFAHRGGAALWPENSMRAYDGAIRLGVDALEVDARYTRDGAVILAHDDTAPAACTSHGQAWAAMTLTQIQATRCAGQPVPLLADLVARLQRPDAARVWLHVEPKPGGPNIVVDILRLTAPIRARTIVQSFHWDQLDQVRQLAPGVPTCALAFNGPLTAAALAYDCVSPYYTAVTAGYVTRAHAAGVVVIPWTVDGPADIARLAGLGVDGIITNRPDLMAQDRATDANEQRNPVSVEPAFMPR